MSSSTYFANPEARAFLQRRVAIFGLIGAILGGTALLFRVIMGVLFGSIEETVTDSGFLLHAAAILPLIGVWLICKRGELSVTAIHTVEYTGIFLASVGYIGMGLDIPPEVGADTITAFILALVMFARSVFVPSSARRTTIMGILIGPSHLAQLRLSRRGRTNGCSVAGRDHDHVVDPHHGPFGPRL
jgi:hypothetical protein